VPFGCPVETDAGLQLIAEGRDQEAYQSTDQRAADLPRTAGDGSGLLTYGIAAG
jgi:hypothetical protein